MDVSGAARGRVTVLALVGLAASGAAGLAAGPEVALAAALPLALVVYSAFLADRGAAHGPGPELVRVNAELDGANAALRWQVIRGVDAILRDASSAAVSDLCAPAALTAAFLAQHAEPRGPVAEPPQLVPAR